jgi:hypothetical protein
MMLSLESWLESDLHSKLFVTTRARQVIRGIMQKFKEVIKRSDGNGLKLTKFHQLLHIPRYILKFGSPKNFNSGRCESHHIKLSKTPAATAQRRQACFEQQVASRISDQLVLSRAFASMSCDPTQFVSPELCGTKFFIFRMEGDDSFQAQQNKVNSILLNYPEVILNGVGELLSPLFGDGCIPCYTEHHRGNNNEVLFRGNPNYRGSEWFDWSYFKWEYELGTHTEIPAKIFFFCDLRSIDPIAEFPPGIYAVIHSMQSTPTLVMNSGLIQKGSLSTNRPFEICDVETISKPAFVYPNLNQDNQFHIISSRQNWSRFMFDADPSH